MSLLLSAPSICYNNINNADVDQNQCFFCYNPALPNTLPKTHVGPEKNHFINTVCFHLNNQTKPQLAFRLVVLDLEATVRFVRANEGRRVFVYPHRSIAPDRFPHILQAKQRCRELEVTAGDWS